ncbi:MAG TPA: Trm112 family protein [Acidobacteriota bacterium]|nr:Trm112 family protein [Acidobacteriota bacterium]
MSESEKELPISPELLEILRCPVAVHYTDRGQDPGRLRLVHNCWLVSDDSGLKYPIRDGIPVMLVEEGEKWKDVPEDQLPVPPPPEE